jgi:hypothetical protein
MKILIDSDLEVVYKVGHRCEPVMYYVEGEPIQYKKDAVAYCIKNEIDPSVITKEKSYFSLEYTLQAVDEILEELFDIIEQRHQYENQVEHFLTGKENFRKDADPEYKANRKDKEKPRYFNEVREHLFKEYDAKQVEGLEADDLIGIRAGELRKEEEDYIIISGDKDLDQIPGLHYNSRHKKFYEVTADEGERYIWQQMLTGDRADNVKGIDKVGDKTALKWMEGVKTEHLKGFVKSEYLVRGIIDRFESNLICLTILQEERK